MKRTFNGIEFTEIEYIYGDESEKQSGLFIHEISDVNGDGDGIIGNGAELPESAEDAKILINGEYIESSFTIDENGIYHI